MREGNFPALGGEAAMEATAFALAAIEGKVQSTAAIGRYGALLAAELPIISGAANFENATQKLIAKILIPGAATVFASKKRSKQNGSGIAALSLFPLPCYKVELHFWVGAISLLAA